MSELAARSVRATLPVLLAALSCACGSAPNPLEESAPPSELTAGQKTLNYAGAPLRLVGAAVVLPVKLLFYDGPLGLWQATLGKDQLDRTLEQLSSDDVAARYRAAEQLRRAAPGVPADRRLEVAAALVRRLPEPSRSVRNQVVLALGRVGERWVVPRLVTLLKDPDAQLRGSTVIALGNLGDPRVGPLLVALYDSPWGENWFVRSAVIQAAGMLGLTELLPRIREQLDRPDPAGGWLLQVVAIQAIGRMGDEASVGRLRRLLASDNEYLRTAAALSLGLLGDPGELAAMLPRAVQARHQLPLIISIGRHGQARDRELLLPYLDSPDATVRAHTAIALVELGDPRGVEGLIQGVASRHVYERLACLGRLERLSGESHGFDEKAWRRWWEANRQRTRLGRTR